MRFLTSPMYTIRRPARSTTPENVGHAIQEDLSHAVIEFRLALTHCPMPHRLVAVPDEPVEQFPGLSFARAGPSSSCRKAASSTAARAKSSSSGRTARIDRLETLVTRPGQDGDQLADKLPPVAQGRPGQVVQAFVRLGSWSPSSA